MAAAPIFRVALVAVDENAPVPQLVTDLLAAAPRPIDAWGNSPRITRSLSALSASQWWPLALLGR
jgi:hypothetical protein